jgi:hypothetical protein
MLFVWSHYQVRNIPNHIGGVIIVVEIGHDRRELEYRLTPKGRAVAK